MDRKLFIQNVARFCFLGVFTAGSVYLYKNNKIEAFEECMASGLCKNCGSFSGCNLPEALKYKINE